MTTHNFADKTVWTGDNLDILRGLNSDCVDLIYLDPPFNSNRNYAAPVGSAAAGAAFKDTWTLSDLDVAWMGLIADEQPAMYQVLQTAGLTHGKGMQSYLCMMAVRLLEMRRVLKETGSIYLHCDPTASHYLKMLMDSIYGQGNFRSEITWRRSHGHSSAKRYGPCMIRCCSTLNLTSTCGPTLDYLTMTLTWLDTSSLMTKMAEENTGPGTLPDQARAMGQPARHGEVLTPPQKADIGCIRLMFWMVWMRMPGFIGQRAQRLGPN